jgi:hypothetical protein
MSSIDRNVLLGAISGDELQILLILVTDDLSTGETANWDNHLYK